MNAQVEPMKGKAGDDGQGRGGLDPTDAALLRAALSPRSLDDLATATSVPRSTVHRRAGHLIEAGLLSWSAQHYQTTPAGQRPLEGAPVSRLPPCHMDAHLPFLNLLPTPVHRAVLLTVFFLGVARRDDVVEDMHAVVALVGATQKLKSWLTKLCCFLFGADPKDCEISMMQTRGRGLLTRLGPRGEVTYESEKVRQPILWLNEVSRMDPRVKRDLVAIMHGRKTINIENRELTIEGVPILEFNLRRRTGSLEERLGLDPPQIRRAFIADFTAVSVSSEMRAQSPELAARIKACGPVALPKAPKTSLPPQYYRLVDQACAECVADEFRDFTDPGRIITLIWGARAWLPDREATEEALYNCFLLYETSGFLKADWRSRLALVLAHPAASAEGAAATPPAAGAVPPVPEPGPAALPWLQDDPAEGSEFDADAGILCLKHLLEKAGLQSPRDDQAIADLLAALAPLHKKRMTPDDVTAVLARLPFLDSLRQWMDNARLAEKDVAAAADLLAALRRNQWGAEELDEALGYKNWLDQSGLSPAEANGLLQQLVAASADQGDVIGFVVAAAREGLTAQSQREELTASVAQMEAEVQSLQEVLRQQRDELARLQQACGQAKTQLAALHEEHAKAQQEVAQQKQLSREQAEHLARAKADLAAAQDQHKTVRLRSFLTLALSEWVTGPDEYFDGQLAEALRDYLLARKLGHQHMQAQARESLDRRAEELLARTPLPEDEAEARRKLLLDLRRQCSEAAAELKSVQRSCQVSSSRQFLTHALAVALIPRTDSEDRFGAQLVPQLLSWLEILVGRGYYADRMRALEEQFGKVAKAAVEGLAQLESQPPPTPGRAPGGGGTSG